MIAEGLHIALHRSSKADALELERSIDEATYFQVRDLDVSIVNREVRVLGICDTYYVKQLVTVAVRESHPHARLLNLVRVCAS